MLYATAATFTRPADTTAYASGDLVANSVTAGSVTPLSWELFNQSRDGVNILRRLRFKKSNNSTTNASFRVHFYTTAPTVTNGDNGAWLSSEAGYLGSVDVTVDKAFNDSTGPAVGVGVPNAGSEINFLVTGGTSKHVLYALVEARAAYTPVSGETFTLTPEIHTV
jgi:hypothetical protein